MHFPLPAKPTFTPSSQQVDRPRTIPPVQGSNTVTAGANTGASASTSTSAILTTSNQSSSSSSSSSSSLPPPLPLIRDAGIVPANHSHKPSPTALSHHTPTPNTAPAAPDKTICAICSAPPKYTCPRCSTRTCSLACTRAHKEGTGSPPSTSMGTGDGAGTGTGSEAIAGCSGMRDPTAFVPLKAYSQSAWGGDYAWLEEGRRKVRAWGEGVKGEEVDAAAGGGGGGGDGNGDRGGGRGRGRGRGGTAGRGGAAGVGVGNHGKGRRGMKLDAFVWELRRKGIWTELMPEGMERRRINQGSWNPANQNLNITLQMIIHAHLLSPSDPSSASSSTTTSQPGHSNSTSTLNQNQNQNQTHTHARVLLSRSANPTRQTHKQGPKKNDKASSSDSNFPKDAGPIEVPALPTLHSLVPPSLLDTNNLIFLLPFHPSPARPMPDIESLDLNLDSSSMPTSTPSRPNPGPRVFFPPLDPTLPLVEIFKGTAWVEFPTIHVMSREEWDRRVGNREVGVVPLAQPRKRERQGEEIDGVGEGQGRFKKRDQGWAGRGGVVVEGEGEKVLQAEIKDQGGGGIAIGVTAVSAPVPVPAPALSSSITPKPLTNISAPQPKTSSSIGLGALTGYASDSDEEEDADIEDEVVVEGEQSAGAQSADADPDVAVDDNGNNDEQGDIAHDDDEDEDDEYGYSEYPVTIGEDADSGQMQDEDGDGEGGMDDGNPLAGIVPGEMLPAVAQALARDMA